MNQAIHSHETGGPDVVKFENVGLGAEGCGARCGGLAGEQADHLIPRAIVDRRVVMKAGTELADIHLHAVAGCEPRIPLPAFPDQLMALQTVPAVAT